MKIAIQCVLLLLLWSCAAKSKIERDANGYTDPEASPPDEIEVVSSNLDTPPEPVGGLEAIQAILRLPEEVTIRNKEGWVIVEATINANGRVASTKVAESSGFPGMDSEAMIAVARVTWKPARKRGTPIMATVRVPVAFEKD
jgi:TonB family protein